MTGYLYVLLSLKDKRTYIGSTDNLKRRILEHEKGLVKSTKDRLPIKLIHNEIRKTLEEARYLEKYYKSCSGRKKLKSKLEKIL